MPGFVDYVTADESIRFLRQVASAEKPFVLWMNTQVPHMDHRHLWPGTRPLSEKVRRDIDAVASILER